MSLKLNTKYLKDFVNEDEMAGIKAQVEAAAQSLHSKNGLGNDFLGWVELPTAYDKEEFARIKVAAERIKANSDILIVIGIGGSYLGARAAIELLKSPLYNNIKKDTPDIYYSVSMTTRTPREGERDGIDYHFVTKTEFLEKLKNNEILEYTEYCDNYYGTPLDILKEKMAEGRKCLLELDVVGAKNVKKIMPEAVLVFIAPPSLKELERRLRNRGTETEESIRKRLKKARKELRDKRIFDKTVVNDDLDTAVCDLENIINEVN